MSILRYKQEGWFDPIPEFLLTKEEIAKLKLGFTVSSIKSINTSFKYNIWIESGTDLKNIAERDIHIAKVRY